jgi:hypothetical protein
MDAALFLPTPPPALSKYANIRAQAPPSKRMRPFLLQAVVWEPDQDLSPAPQYAASQVARQAESIRQAAACPEQGDPSGIYDRVAARSVYNATPPRRSLPPPAPGPHSQQQPIPDARFINVAGAQHRSCPVRGRSQGSMA